MKREPQSPSFASVMEELREKHGGNIRKLTGTPDRRRIPLGVFPIDRVLGGGLPVNRITLIRGREGSYKTTLALKTLGNYLNACINCLIHVDFCECGKTEPHKKVGVFIDTEQALDEGYVIRLGIDPSRIYLFQPKHGELACEYAEQLVKLPEVGAVIVDSLALLIPNAQLETSYMDSMARGLRAKLITRMFQAMVGYLNRPRDEFPKIAITLNHVLDRIDGGAFAGEYSPGGHTQLYLNSLQLKLWKAGKARAKQTELEAIEGTRRQEFGFLIERSKVSRSNVAGEFELFIDPSPGATPIYGTADDFDSVSYWAKHLGLASGDDKITYLYPKDKLLENKAFGPTAQRNLFLSHPKLYWQLQQEIIRQTFKDQ